MQGYGETGYDGPDQDDLTASDIASNTWPHGQRFRPIDPREGERPTLVYVLRYWHKHGDDISVHATPELADEAIAGIVRLWWEEVRGEHGVPDTPGGLSDEDAVRLYFDHQDGRSEPEGYEILARPVQG
jgi:hypothetical protein